MDVKRLKHWSDPQEPLLISTTTHPHNYQPMKSQQAHLGKGLEHYWLSSGSMDELHWLLTFPFQTEADLWRNCMTLGR